MLEFEFFVQEYRTSNKSDKDWVEDFKERLIEFKQKFQTPKNKKGYIKHTEEIFSDIPAKRNGRWYMESDIVMDPCLPVEFGYSYAVCFDPRKKSHIFAYKGILSGFLPDEEETITGGTTYTAQHTGTEIKELPKSREKGWWNKKYALKGLRGFVKKDGEFRYKMSCWAGATFEKGDQILAWPVDQKDKFYGFLESTIKGLGAKKIGIYHQREASDIPFSMEPLKQKFDTDENLE